MEELKEIALKVAGIQFDLETMSVDESKKALIIGLANDLQVIEQTMLLLAKGDVPQYVNNKAKVFLDPSFSEYAFNVMHSATDEQKRSLTFREIYHFRDDVSIRRFVDDNSFERILYMLARLGSTWTIVVSAEHPTVDVVGKIIDEAKDVIVAKTGESVVKSMKDGKMFVIGSKDVALSCAVAAMGSHSQQYMLNYSLARLNDYLMNMKKETNTEMFKQATKGLDKLADLALGAITNADLIESICGISTYKMMILLAMFRHRDTFLTGQQVAGLIHETARQRPKGAAKVLAWMCDEGLCTWVNGSVHYNKQKIYTILEPGMKKVCTFLEYIVHEKKVYS